MNSIRYIITRFCLQDGSMRLLKYNENYFPEAGPVQFKDESGSEYIVQVDRKKMCVTDLDNLYRDLNLGVNDVLIISPLEQGHYQVKATVKPLAPAKNKKRETETSKGRAHVKPSTTPVTETKRIVVASSPHVKEVRLQVTNTSAVPVASKTAEQQPKEEAVILTKQASTIQQGQHTGEKLVGRHSEPVDGTPAPAQVTKQQAKSKPSFFSKPFWSSKKKEEVDEVVSDIDQRNSQEMRALAHQNQNMTHTAVPTATTPTPAMPSQVEDQLCELARLSGYRTEFVGKNLIRLLADLGPKYGYSVLVALDAGARKEKLWQEQRDDHHVQITTENERLPDVARLTQEALVALIEHARLTPLSPMDLRGYWRAGNLDLESAASIAELVSAHLAQRGAFSYVLLTLAQQPAHSVVSVSRLAERLGSGVNTAELNTILETLSRSPFLALAPMHGGQYLMRASVPELLGNTIEYAQTIYSRLNQQGQDIPSPSSASQRSATPSSTSTKTTTSSQSKRTVTV